jgi:hypothetical protein
MARYFFHLESGKVKAEDKKGHESASIEDALVHARRMVVETLPFLNDKDGRWIIRVQSANQPFELFVLFPAPTPFCTRKTLLERLGTRSLRPPQHRE